MKKCPECETEHPDGWDYGKGDPCYVCGLNSMGRPRWADADMKARLAEASAERAERDRDALLVKVKEKS